MRASFSGFVATFLFFLIIKNVFSHCTVRGIVSLCPKVSPASPRLLSVFPP